MNAQRRWHAKALKGTEPEATYPSPGLDMGTAMRTICLLLTVLSLTACGPAHSHEPIIEVGRTLDLSVNVPDDRAPYAEGEVFYRVVGDAGYESAILTKRGNELWHTLDVRDLPIGTSVEYYFDIYAEGELHQVRSPTNPFVTTIGSRQDVIFSKLTTDVYHGDADDDVTFELDTHGVTIDRAEVMYFAPNIRGRVTADMYGGGSTYKFRIPAKHVAAGNWQYCVKVYAEGFAFELPAGGTESFYVREP